MRSAAEAQAASRALSQDDISVFRAVAAPVAGLPPGDARDGPLAHAGAPLAAFSVPTHCVPPRSGDGACDDSRGGVDGGHGRGGCTGELFEARVAAWVGGMRAALAGGGDGGWAAEVSLQRDDRGLQPVSL